MARQPNPVHPTVKQASRYYKDIRRLYLVPLFGELERGMATATASNQAWRTMDEVIRKLQAKPHAGVPVEAIQKALDGMEGYHRERLKTTFQKALGINITSLLRERTVQTFMEDARLRNIALIKTIPRRLHVKLAERMADQFADFPFDQKYLKDMLRLEFKSSGYNLRRITRDQTNKTIGKLTELRQRELGVQEYQWLTSQDERVRTSHVANSGRMFSWADPPPETGHPGEDIQCRCVAIPIVTQAQRQRLKDVTAHSEHQIGISDPSVPVAPPKDIVPDVPEPPTPPAPKTWGDIDVVSKDFGDRSLEELAWHTKAWTDLTSMAARAAAMTDAVKVTQTIKDGAWYRGSARRIEMDQLKKDKNGLNTWRHEFGHCIDNTAGELSEEALYATDSALVRKARLRDKDKIKEWSDTNYDLKVGTQANDALDVEAAQMSKMSDNARRRRLKAVEARGDITIAEARAFMKEHGYRSVADFTGGDANKVHDALLYRFMRGLEVGDVEGAMHAAFPSGSFGGRTMGMLDASLQKWRSKLIAAHDAANTFNHGALSNLSDIADAMTDGKVNRGWGHAASYYKGNNKARDKENFANMAAMDGAGPVARKVVSLMFPNTWEQYERIMTQYLEAYMQ